MKTLRISFLLAVLMCLFTASAYADEFYYDGGVHYNPYNGYTVMSLPPPPPMNTVPFYVRDDYDDYVEDYYECILGYEYKGLTNGQARVRTLELMDLANRTGGLVVGTGDLSELALGWATYNGDHMSMYGVNAGVREAHFFPKTVLLGLPDRCNLPRGSSGRGEEAAAAPR